MLGIAKVELYMPREEILADGDHVNELIICVEGWVMEENGRLSLTPEDLVLVRRAICCVLSSTLRD